MKYFVFKTGCPDAQFDGPDAAGAARMFALRAKAAGIPGAIVSESATGFQSTMDSWDNEARH